MAGPVSRTRLIRRSDFEHIVSYVLGGLLNHLHLLANACAGCLVAAFGLVDVCFNFCDKLFKIFVCLHESCLLWKQVNIYITYLIIRSFTRLTAIFQIQFLNYSNNFRVSSAIRCPLRAHWPLTRSSGLPIETGP